MTINLYEIAKWLPDRHYENRQQEVDQIEALSHATILLGCDRSSWHEEADTWSIEKVRAHYLAYCDLRTAYERCAHDFAHNLTGTIEMDREDYDYIESRRSTLLERITELTTVAEVNA